MKITSGNLVLIGILIPTVISIHLNEFGGYDVTVRIQSSLDYSEPNEYLGRIKDALTQLSQHMLEATDGTFWIQSINVVIPNSWELEDIVCPIENEVPPSSDIQILEKIKVPYVVNPTICGLPGYLIELPLTFFEDSKIYGEEIWRPLLVLWARYRWGVWEEHGYPEHEKFPYAYYRDVNESSLTLTGCSNEELRGSFTAKGQECNPLDGNPTCKFQLEEDQIATSSLTHFYWVKSAHLFCDEHTHDGNAPNKQNLYCNHQSVLEVIRNSADARLVSKIFRGTTEAPTFSCFKQKEMAIQNAISVTGWTTAQNGVSDLSQVIHDEIPFGIYVRLFNEEEGKALISGDVQAMFISEEGTANYDVTLYDDGTSGDLFPYDGIYSNTHVPLEDSNYTIAISVSGKAMTRPWNSFPINGLLPVDQSFEGIEPDVENLPSDYSFSGDIAKVQVVNGDTFLSVISNVRDLRVTVGWNPIKKTPRLIFKMNPAQIFTRGSGDILLTYKLFQATDPALLLGLTGDSSTDFPDGLILLKETRKSGSGVVLPFEIKVDDPEEDKCYWYGIAVQGTISGSPMKASKISNIVRFVFYNDGAPTENPENTTVPPASSDTSIITTKDTTSAFPISDSSRRSPSSTSRTSDGSSESTISTISPESTASTIHPSTDGPNSSPDSSRTTKSESSTSEGESTSSSTGGIATTKTSTGKSTDSDTIGTTSTSEAWTKPPAEKPWARTPVGIAVITLLVLLIASLGTGLAYQYLVVNRRTYSQFKRISPESSIIS